MVDYQLPRDQLISILKNLQLRQQLWKFLRPIIVITCSEYQKSTFDLSELSFKYDYLLSKPIEIAELN